jgi:2-dehydro-3-deoxy-L-rhamnonate dehydrogenase (NAD+)
MRRRALVTGAASGIGQACAARLAADGLEVVTLDLTPGCDLQADVTTTGSVTAALAGAAPFDVLVNSAGVVGPNRPTWQVEDDEWERTFAVNTTGTFRMCRAVVPGMVERGWGRIVNLASIAGKEGNPNLAAYSASKAAVIGLTKSLGKELATTGVLVNAVAPAVIATPMNATNAPDVLDYMVSRIPMGRLGTVDEVAELVSWLGSDRCSFSTAAVYDLSGGRATY